LTKISYETGCYCIRNTGTFSSFSPGHPFFAIGAMILAKGSPTFYKLKEKIKLNIQNFKTG
jgi:uncharacterized membrane protein YbaN (DUF454 family)